MREVLERIDGIRIRVQIFADDVVSRFEIQEPVFAVHVGRLAVDQIPVKDLDRRRVCERVHRPCPAEAVQIELNTFEHLLTQRRETLSVRRDVVGDSVGVEVVKFRPMDAAKYVVTERAATLHTIAIDRTVDVLTADQGVIQHEVAGNQTLLIVGHAVIVDVLEIGGQLAERVTPRWQVVEREGAVGGRGGHQVDRRSGPGGALQSEQSPGQGRVPTGRAERSAGIDVFIFEPADAARAIVAVGQQIVGGSAKDVERVTLFERNVSAGSAMGPVGPLGFDTDERRAAGVGFGGHGEQRRVRFDVGQVENAEVTRRCERPRGTGRLSGGQHPTGTGDLPDVIEAGDEILKIEFARGVGGIGVHQRPLEVSRLAAPIEIDLKIEVRQAGFAGVQDAVAIDVFVFDAVGRDGDVIHPHLAEPVAGIGQVDLVTAEDR